MHRIAPFMALLACAFVARATTVALPAEDLGARLERHDYPYPVHHFRMTNQGHVLEMAYMDLAPDKPDGRVAVLLHGKNFCAPYWIATAVHLRRQGWRVVLPDQVGFCKSSRPRDYQYSLHQLAANTHALLASLGVERSTVIAHSMGGMVGARLALMYPQAVDRLVLVNPLGLEDWKAKGVPWRSVDDWYRQELGTSAATIKAYQLKAYYDGAWKPEYDRWVTLQAGMYEGSGRDVSAWASALTYDMIYTQPVVHEFPQLRVPTVLIIGQRDRTAVGRDAASAEVAAKLGDYPALGRDAARRIPGAKLIALDALGHSPMLESPERFERALDEALGADAPTAVK
jgi:pimeloyl-ACP methyl ester carboxylesterase